MISSVQSLDLDVSKSKDAALMDLYALLVAKNAPKPGAFATLSADQRRAYFTAARRRSRARERAAASMGALEANTANVRNALADAALMILATDAPGADLVLQVLGGVFERKPGVPLLVQQRARAGKLRPKLVGCGS